MKIFSDNTSIYFVLATKVTLCNELGELIIYTNGIEIFTVSKHYNIAFTTLSVSLNFGCPLYKQY